MNMTFDLSKCSPPLIVESDVLILSEYEYLTRDRDGLWIETREPYRKQTIWERLICRDAPTRLVGRRLVKQFRDDLDQRLGGVAAGMPPVPKEPIE